MPPQWRARDVCPGGPRRYNNALLLLKNGQNPSVGTIVASMHPAYQFKTWGRDGTFAAMILDSAGFHAEAALYLRWMAGAQVSLSRRSATSAWRAVTHGTTLGAVG